MSKKGLLYLGFFAVLVCAFYFSVRKWIVRNNSTISTVRPFAFTNQDGQQVTDKDLEGKVYVAEFFFTNCPGICPTMNANMHKVYTAFKDNPNFRILAHTSDPERDSVPVLKRYADSLKVNTNSWIFVTGRKDSLYNAARFSYTVDDPVNNLKSIDDQFLHTQFWALVDQEGQVKKVVDGLKNEEVAELIADIEKMLKK